MAGSLAGVVVAVLGGDARMLEHIRSAIADGATVRHHGCVPEAAGVNGALAAATPEEALAGAHIVSCPIPGVGVDAALYAPHAPAPIRLTADLLRLLAPGAVVFSGPMPPEMEAWAHEAGVKALDYSEDDPLSILHAIPTAEGAIRVAVEHTPETICGMRTLCIGYGRVGVSVAAAFQAMNARVTVAARNPVQLARAESLGLDTVHTDRLAELRPDRQLPHREAGDAGGDGGGEARCADHRPPLPARQRGPRCREGTRPQGGVGTGPGWHRAAHGGAQRVARADADLERDARVMHA